MDLLALVYISTANVRLRTREAVDALLLDARAFNTKVSVTGVLLYSNGSFFQYLEGPAASVEQVYDRIRGSAGHGNLYELMREPITQRHFPSWSMGFAEPTASELQAIAQSEWSRERVRLEHVGTASPALMLLMDFWRRAVREA